MDQELVEPGAHVVPFKFFKIGRITPLGHGVIRGAIYPVPRFGGRNQGTQAPEPADL